MKIVSIEDHDFNKTNLVTDRKGRDHYECKNCGCKGFRSNIRPIITMTEKEYSKSLKCEYQKPETIRVKPVRVLLDSTPHLGIECGVFDVVECPKEYETKFKHDVWVFSPGRKEPIRILPHEIIDQEWE